MNYFSKYILTTNHILIGLYYVITGFIGGSIGLALSLLIRLELALPGYILCSSIQYNSCITFHGLFMIFYFIMPVLIGGFGNLLLPLMLHTSDMIFPRLNALSLWIGAFALFIFILAFIIDGGVNSGWTIYVPLSILNQSSIDLLIFSLHALGLSSLLSSINFVTSIFKGSVLSLNSSTFGISLFCWSIFVTSILLILSLPVLAACITMIIFDRHFNSSFFDPIRGGDVLYFQHLFWFFGHPEVYVLILPGFGLISEVLSKLTHSVIFSRDAMLVALFIIALLGCIVWGHHMFTVGFDINSKLYFTLATSIIAIPTAVKIINWLATLWSSCFYYTTSLFFTIGFIFNFTFGGFTGLIIANCVIDNILHDSYFVVAHFHYVLSLGAIYALLSGIYHYSNLLLGIVHNEFIGRLFYIILFTTSNCTFLAMHALGITSCPRRIYDHTLLWSRQNYSISFSLFGIVLSFVLFILSFLTS